MSDTTTLTKYTDSISHMMAVARSAPMLTPEEENRLITRLYEHKDVAAAERLIMAHMRMVPPIARKFVNYGVPQEDLIQEGTIGLMKAVKAFDHTRGIRLSTFATPHIRYQMYEYIMNNIRPVKIVTTKPLRKVFFNLRSMTASEYRRSLHDDDVKRIAAELDVKPEEVREMEVRLLSHDISTDTPSGDGFTNPIDFIAQDGADPVEILAEDEIETKTNAWMAEALSTLSERSRYVIECRYLNPTKTGLQDLANELGISAERVRQIEVHALRALRTSGYTTGVADLVMQ